MTAEMLAVQLRTLAVRARVGGLPRRAGRQPPRWDSRNRLVCYFLAAIAFHVRVRDFEADHLFPAVLMLAVSVTALVLRLAA
jgi:hypothetical protein